MHCTCDFLVNSVLLILTGKKMFLMHAILFLLHYLANNASLNAVNVSALDRQNLNQYSAGPCEWYSK